MMSDFSGHFSETMDLWTYGPPFNSALVEDGKHVSAGGQECRSLLVLREKEAITASADTTLITAPSVVSMGVVGWSGVITAGKRQVLALYY
jgi:hypothetical protein